MWNESTQLGLPRPKNDIPLTDFNEIRREIDNAYRDSSLIRNCLRQAQYAGLSGEDKYTLLAYQALIALETYWQQSLQIAKLSPVPPVIVKEGSPDQLSDRI